MNKISDQDKVLLLLNHTREIMLSRIAGFAAYTKIEPNPMSLRKLKETVKQLQHAIDIVNNENLSLELYKGRLRNFKLIPELVYKGDDVINFIAELNKQYGVTENGE